MVLENVVKVRGPEGEGVKNMKVSEVFSTFHLGLQGEWFLIY